MNTEKLKAKVDKALEDKYNEGWSDGYDEGYSSENESESFNDGVIHERKRIEDVIKMNLAWAMQENKASQIVFWKNALSILVQLPNTYINNINEEDLRKELEEFGF